MRVKKMSQLQQQGLADNDKKWLVQDFIRYTARPAIIVGAPGCGKGVLGLQLAECVAYGTPWLDRPVQQMPTMYISYEDDWADIKQRSINRSKKVNPLNADATACHICYAGDDDLTFTMMQGNKLVTGAGYKEILSYVQDNGIKMIVIDHLSHIYCGDENSREQVNAFCKILTKFCADAGCMVVILAHTNKIGDYSGSSANAGSYRQMYIIHYNRTKNTRSIQCIKSNIAKDTTSITYTQDDDFYCHTTADAEAVSSTDQTISAIQAFLADGKAHNRLDICGACGIDIKLSAKAFGALMKQAGYVSKKARNPYSKQIQTIYVKEVL